MTKPMGFADQCKPSFARPVREGEEPRGIFCSLCRPARVAGGSSAGSGKRVHLPIYFRPNGRRFATGSRHSRVTFSRSDTTRDAQRFCTTSREQPQISLNILIRLTSVRQIEDVRHRVSDVGFWPTFAPAYLTTADSESQSPYITLEVKTGREYTEAHRRDVINDTRNSRIEFHRAHFRAAETKNDRIRRIEVDRFVGREGKDLRSAAIGDTYFPRAGGQA